MVLSGYETFMVVYFFLVCLNHKNVSTQSYNVMRPHWLVAQSACYNPSTLKCLLLLCDTEIGTFIYGFKQYFCMSTHWGLSTTFKVAVSHFCFLPMCSPSTWRTCKIFQVPFKALNRKVVSNHRIKKERTRRWQRQRWQR